MYWCALRWYALLVVCFLSIQYVIPLKWQEEASFGILALFGVALLYVAQRAYNDGKEQGEQQYLEDADTVLTAELNRRRDRQPRSRAYGG